MDAQSAPLKLFKEQLENESRKFAEHQALTERGHWLIWWYFSMLKRYSQERINEIVCDGGGDLGIDALDIDSDDHVHFYQFKNPEALEKSTFESGDIDRVLAGLHAILNRKHETIANPELRGRIEEIFQIVPSGYTLHIVTSSISSLSAESKQKLDGFVESLNGMPTYVFEDLRFLWDAFYTSHLPTLDEPLQFALENNPYPVKSSNHESYIFHLNATPIAEVYRKYGERLLQQNIRVSAGDNATNKAIESTCTGKDSGRFFHFNNGITFLCDSAGFDFFTKRLELTRAQVVNGGQTVRVLAKAYVEGRLKPDTLVLV
ncbi:MAG: AIPR family protein [Bryobacterales bacterium]|nr:AIPR family protein [Bryobacterales bacterium]